MKLVVRESVKLIPIDFTEKFTIDDEPSDTAFLTTRLLVLDRSSLMAVVTLPDQISSSVFKPLMDSFHGTRSSNITAAFAA